MYMQISVANASASVEDLELKVTAYNKASIHFKKNLNGAIDNRFSLIQRWKTETKGGPIIAFNSIETEWFYVDPLKERHAWAGAVSQLDKKTVKIELEGNAWVPGGTVEITFKMCDKDGDYILLMEKCCVKTIDRIQVDKVIIKGLMEEDRKA